MSGTGIIDLIYSFFPFSEVLLGEYDVGENPDQNYPRVIRRSIESVHVHENFDRSQPFFGNDIALLKLKKKVSKRAQYVTPVCLPWIETDVYEYLNDRDGSKLDGKKFKFTGWGKRSNNQVLKEGINNKTNEKYYAFSTIPYTVALKHVPNERCSAHFIRGLPSNQFCTRGVKRGESDCEGDNGGPLIYNDFPPDCEFI